VPGCAAQYLRLAGLRRGARESFDSAGAEALCGELDTAIDAFIDAIRPDLKSD
jgi:hypothetical protein